MQVHQHQCINIETSRMQCNSNSSNSTGARGVALMFTTVQQTTGQKQNGGSSTLGPKKRAEMPLPPVQTTSSRRAKAVTTGSGPPLEKGGRITVRAFRAESFDDESVRLGFLIARKDMQLAVLGLACAWLREVLTPLIIEGI